VKRSALACAILLCCVGAAADDPPRRPHIFGIAQVTVYTTQPAAAQAFYSKILRTMEPANCAHCDRVMIDPRYSVNREQLVGVYSTPNAPPNLIADLTFATDDISALRRYLEFHKVAVTSNRPGDRGQTQMPLIVTDPEGHQISFTYWKEGMPPMTPELLDRQEIIHAGFIVKDRAAEDAFYKDILGFHVYWHGGMKDGTDDWVDMQVPDGTDWLEYMLNAPANPDQHTRGVLDHLAIGVHDIHKTYDELVTRGVTFSEKPQIGRDGKWQLNLYDPDQTRVEFMERKPEQEPCCSPYTGPHPGQPLNEKPSPSAQ
jgi:catechol 2,3-dioxygenase-like lactoylglutathione lyase family enzyme